MHNLPPRILKGISVFWNLLWVPFWVYRSDWKISFEMSSTKLQIFMVYFIVLWSILFLIFFLSALEVNCEFTRSSIFDIYKHRNYRPILCISINTNSAKNLGIMQNKYWIAMCVWMIHCSITPKKARMNVFSDFKSTVSTVTPLVGQQPLVIQVHQKNKSVCPKTFPNYSDHSGCLITTFQYPSFSCKDHE